MKYQRHDNVTHILITRNTQHQRGTCSRGDLLKIDRSTKEQDADISAADAKALMDIKKAVPGHKENLESLKKDGAEMKAAISKQAAADPGAAVADAKAEAAAIIDAAKAEAKAITDKAKQETKAK